MLKEAHKDANEIARHGMMIGFVTALFPEEKNRMKSEK